MFDRFTDRAKKVMKLARQEALRLNHEYLGTEHILLGLLAEGSGVAANVLKNMDVDLVRIRAEVEKLVKTGPALGSMEQLPFTPRAKKVLEFALEEASGFGHNYIGTEHLLLGLLREAEGIAARILTGGGVRLEEFRAEVLEFLGADEGDDADVEESEPQVEQAKHDPKASATSSRAKDAASRTPALDAFGEDLTEQARLGRLDAFAARDGLLDLVLRQLLRRSNPAAVLLGEPGTGKTALTHGLARRLVSGDVPVPLRGSRLLAVSLPRLLAGTKYRGQLEERVAALTREAAADPALLVLDSLHLLIERQHAYGEGELAVADVLGPAISAGLRCVGTASEERWRQVAMSNPALARRFQEVHVPPATAEETSAIVRAARGRLEEHHGVRYGDDALVAAVELAPRYAPDRHLPGAALDLLDECAALAALERDRVPEELQELAREIERLHAEKQAHVNVGDFVAATSARERAYALEERRKQLVREQQDRTEKHSAREVRAISAEYIERIVDERQS